MLDKVTKNKKSAIRIDGQRVEYLENKTDPSRKQPFKEEDLHEIVVFVSRTVERFPFVDRQNFYTKHNSFPEELKLNQVKGHFAKAGECTGVLKSDGADQHLELYRDKQWVRKKRDSPGRPALLRRAGRGCAGSPCRHCDAELRAGPGREVSGEEQVR